MKSIYIETTIPSLATARTSRDAIIAGQQAATNAFWEDERGKYELYISQYVIDECAKGDREAAQKRLDFIKDIQIIPKTDNTDELAKKYKKLLSIPDRANIDAYHLAVSVIAQIDYLLSWNYTHLGVASYAKLFEYNQKYRLKTPLLVTPMALMNMEEV
jgi:hypothetical protein